MPPQIPRHSICAPPPRHRRPANFARPQCEQLEERISLALFNVQTPLTFTGLNNNGCVAVSDLNKDGRKDAILTNFGTDYGTGAGTTITVLYGNATGGFNRINLNTSGTNVSHVSIADINGDNWPDVVASNANSQNIGSVSVFQNDGAGNLVLVGTPFSTFSNNPSRVELGDLTGDGVLDVVVASFGKDDGSGNIVGSNVTIFQGNADAQGHGNFTFSSGPITTLVPDVAPLRFAPTSLALADFDGDGLKDIAAVVPNPPPSFGQPEPEGTVYCFRGTGGGGFAATTQFGSGGARPLNIQAANLNGDNKPDLVIANAGDPNANPEWSGDAVGVLLNASTGPGNVSFGVTTSVIANTHGPLAVAVADFDLDGKADIAAVNFGSQLFSPAAFVSIYLGNGAGTFTPDTPGTYDTLTGLGGGQYLAVGDLDGNRTPDLIVAHASNRVGRLLNTTASPAGVTWTGFGDGTHWTDPMNWSTVAVPTPADDVMISVALNPTVQVTTGTQSIRSLGSDETLAIAGGTLDIAQSSQIAGIFTLSSGSLSGNGDLQLINAMNSWTGGTMSGSGKTTIAAGAVLALTGGPGARTSTRGLQVEGQVSVSAGGVIVPMFSSLEIGASGHFDLADNDLVIDYSSVSPVGIWTGDAYDGITGHVAAGRIFSSAAVGSLKHLGVAEAREALNITGSQTGAFAGQSVDSTSVLVKFTWGGDATLDGKINIDDYGRIDGNVAQSGVVFGWFSGDFNYDGKLNIDDYGIIDGNINQQDQIL